MNEQLNFAEKSVQVLTLEQLERSYHENMPDGQPVGGIYHFQLIREIMQIFENCNLVPMVTEIFAAANRDSKRPGVTVLPQLEERYGERANIYLHDRATYPLNSAQINEAVEAMMERLEIYHVTSYWDVYQDLNSVLKPDRMDIPQVLPQSLALYECLKKQLS